MKKMFLFVFAFIFVGSVFAYTPSTKDTANLAHLKSQLSGLIEKNNINLRDFYNQLRILQSDYSQDARLNYMLGNLKDHLYDNLSAQKTSAKILSKDSKQEFLDQYLTGISKDISGSLNNCTSRALVIDISNLLSHTSNLEIFAHRKTSQKVPEDYVNTTINIPADGKIKIKLAPGGGWAAIQK